MIGILRWAVEIGRVDILLEVSLLSSHLALPRIGHIQAVYHIFGYLKQVPKRKLYFDPVSPLISEDRFYKFNWEDFYRNSKESIPYDMPKPRGEIMTTHSFVDANHAMNFDQKVDDSTEFCLLLNQIIGARLQNISIPVCERLVTLSAAWLASTKQCVVMILPLGFGISSGIASLKSR